MQINEVEVNTNIFTIEAIRPYLYEQYKNIEGLEGLVEALANYIQDNYFSKILEMWSCRDIARSLSPYLTFYSRYYLGIIRPIQVDSGDMDTEIDTDTVKNLYDTAVKYDMRFIYDDFYQSKPFITAAQFITFLRFIYDYSRLTWTHDYIISYASKMTGVEPIDIKIKFFPHKVVYYLLGTTRSRDFIAAHNNDEYQMCMPACKCYEFALGDHERSSDNLNSMMLGYLRPDTWTKIDPNTPPPEFPDNEDEIEK